MRQEIERLLQSEEDRDGLRAFKELLVDCHKNHRRLPAQDLLKLTHVLRDTAGADPWRVEMAILVELMVRTFDQSAVVVQAGRSTPSSAPHEWLWYPFHEPSAWFGTAVDTNVRDGLALLELAVALKPRFPRCDVKFVPVGQPQWEEMLHRQSYRAICFLGRLGLFGLEAVRRLSDDKATIDFLIQERPAGWPPHKLHPEYHRIRAKLEDGRFEEHCPVKAGDQWTDYALVRRYPVDYSGRRVIVVQCAGCTSLGTLGATQWAASLLNGLTDSQGAPAPCPPGIHCDSRLEALLEVHGNETNGIRTPDQVEIMKMTIDGSTWCREERCWRSEHKISVRCLQGDPQQPLAVVIDGKEQRMKRDGQTFQLLVALCLLAARAKGDGRIDTVQLARDPAVFPKGPVDNRTLRQHLISLKHHYLRPILSIDEDVYCHATVEICRVEPDPPMVRSDGAPRQPRVRKTRKRPAEPGDGLVVES